MNKKENDLSKFTYEKLYVRMLCAFLPNNNVSNWKEVHNKTLSGFPPTQCRDSFKSLILHNPPLIKPISKQEAISLCSNFANRNSRCRSFYKLTEFGKIAAEHAIKTKEAVEFLKVLKQSCSYEEACIKLEIADYPIKLNKSDIEKLTNSLLQSNSNKLADRIHMHPFVKQALSS